MNMQPVNIRLPEKKIEKIDEIARKNGITRSEVIRQALTIYFSILENLGEFTDVRNLKITPNQISTTKLRDILVLRLKNRQAIVIANTSSGGVGPKPDDRIRLDGDEVGRLMARTALIKVLSSGASPITLIANLSVERFPSGFEIFRGIREVAQRAKVNEILEGHTEENIETTQTGMGIFALGIANENDLKIGKSLKGDLVVAIGDPKVGHEVIKNGKGIVDVEDVLKLSKENFIHEIIPVGHEGIEGELELMENLGGYKIERKDSEIDTKKSAGPSTVVLVTFKEEQMEKLRKIVRKPFYIVGKIL
ncbi:MAG: ribbon-helix-helix domain-containing protein [Candidatus Syntropharchaeia archaeon]